MLRATFLSWECFTGVMRTANPTLSEKLFSNFGHVYDSHKMTIEGAVNKTGLLLILLVIMGAFSWQAFLVFPEFALFGVIGSALAALVVAIVLIFKREYAAILAPIYALLEGVVLGVLSALFESLYSGIVMQAILVTIGVLFALLFAYKSRWVEATENFKLGVIAATGGIFVVYLISFIAGLFGVSIPYIHESGAIGIAFSLFVVVVAALNLVLDFDFIEKGAMHGAPKYMEWYGAFGLLVTLVWLYLEVLKLLSKVRSRD